MKGSDPSGIFLNEAVYDLACAIGRTVVDGNNRKLAFRIVNVQEGSQNVGDHGFFVVRGDKNGDSRPVGGVNVNVGVPLLARDAIQREAVVPQPVDADENDYCAK